MLTIQWRGSTTTSSKRNLYLLQYMTPTYYRKWKEKETQALELFFEAATPHRGMHHPRSAELQRRQGTSVMKEAIGWYMLLLQLGLWYEPNASEQERTLRIFQIRTWSILLKPAPPDPGCSIQAAFPPEFPRSKWIHVSVFSRQSNLLCTLRGGKAAGTQHGEVVPFLVNCRPDHCYLRLLSLFISVQ